MSQRSFNGRGSRDSERVTPTRLQTRAQIANALTVTSGDPVASFFEQAVPAVVATNYGPGLKLLDDFLLVMTQVPVHTEEDVRKASHVRKLRTNEESKHTCKIVSDAAKALRQVPALMSKDDDAELLHPSCREAWDALGNSLLLRILSEPSVQMDSLSRFAFRIRPCIKVYVQSQRAAIVREPVSSVEPSPVVANAQRVRGRRGRTKVSSLN